MHTDLRVFLWFVLQVLLSLSLHLHNLGASRVGKALGIHSIYNRHFVWLERLLRFPYCSQILLFLWH
nr:MAG TPA: hypothetical protein [Caudoviricetes sp.]